jgi:hypothetical protein
MNNINQKNKKRGQATFSDVQSTSRNCHRLHRKSSLSPFFPFFLFADDAFIMDNKEKKEIK